MSVIPDDRAAAVDLGAGIHDVPPGVQIPMDDAHVRWFTIVCLGRGQGGVRAPVCSHKRRAITRRNHLDDRAATAT